MSELQLFDTHCHLTDEQYDNYGEIVQSARSAGVNEIVIVGLDVASSIQSSELADTHNLYFSAGLHPCYPEQPEGTLQVLRTLHARPRCVAVGEIGLDFFWHDTPIPLQYSRFQSMLALAVEFALPVILHQRLSFDEIWNELRCVDLPQGGVFHCWSGTIQQAELVLADGYYISFAGNITYKKNEQLRQVAAMVPTDRLLIETDAPYMAPGKYRGKRNEPAYIVQTAKFLAELRGVTVQEIAEITSSNAHRLFQSKITNARS